MGGGPVLEEVYLPYHWSASHQFHDLPFYASTSWPGYDGFDVQFPLFELLSTLHDWLSYTTYDNCHHEQANEAVANNNQVQVMEPYAKKGDEVSVDVIQPIVPSEEVKEIGSQLEEVEKQLGFQSEEVGKEGVFETEATDENDGVVELEEMQKDGGFEPEVVDEKEGEIQQQEVQENEISNDEERVAATVVQARYRGHVVRMTRPLVQLRAIAVVAAKLKKLKEQAGSKSFEEEIRKVKSTAMMGFEEDTLALLMQLDNIQGSHPLVRQIRKSVVREIVDLQKTVDALPTDIESNRVYQRIQNPNSRR